MRPAAQMFMTPVIGVVCFAVILANWFGGVRYFRGVPAGLVAIAVGVVIAWGSSAFGFDYGGMSLGHIGAALGSFGFAVPLPAVGHVFSGFKFLGVILVTAIPFGIYDLVEAMDNVESAAAAGDAFPTTRVLTADGVVSLIGCLMGNPFINAVYIGHPGWKAMGGRIGYSAATGVMVLVLTWFGVIALMMALIPVVAILPILLYIGMLIGSQAFQETPRRHAPAIVLALVPQIAAWGKTQIDSALGAAGTSAHALGFDKLAGAGVLYDGLETLGGGATLAGIVLGAITVFIIEREFNKAAAFALAGAVLTFFGFIHGEAIGIGQSPAVALSYLLVAGLLFTAPTTPPSPSRWRSRSMSVGSTRTACRRTRPPDTAAAARPVQCPGDQCPGVSAQASMKGAPAAVPGGERLGGHGPGDVEPLGERHAELGHQGPEMRVGHTLGDDEEAARLGRGDGAAQEPPRRRAGRALPHHGLVEFQHREIEREQRAWVAQPRPHVVDRYAISGAPEPVHHDRKIGQPGERAALGEFDGESLGRHAGLHAAALQPRDRVGAQQNVERQVHGQPCGERREPRGPVGDDAPCDRPAQRPCEPRAFGRRHEGGGAEQATLHPREPRQGLESHRRGIGDAHDRLIARVDARPFQRATKFARTEQCLRFRALTRDPRLRPPTRPQIAHCEVSREARIRCKSEIG